MNTPARKDRVRRAIEFRRPGRVPVVFWNRDQAQGDLMLYRLSLGAPGEGSVDAWDWSINGWGYRLVKQAFMVPISYQTVSIQGTPEEIHAEARRLYECLGTPEGGFIGYVEEYSVMGMSEDNYQACGQAFCRLNEFKPNEYT